MNKPGILYEKFRERVEKPGRLSENVRETYEKARYEKA
jgi:hypothetical protein